MLDRIWLFGTLLHRPGRALGAALGIGLTVAILASIGAYSAVSSATMTQRAVETVPVDWQVLLSQGTDPAAAAAAVRSTTQPLALEQVGYADAAGFKAGAGGSVQTVGAGTVLGIPDTYRHTFPAEIRPLVGAADGVLIAQQAAANLAVTAGDTVEIQRVDLPPVAVKIDGVVDLPSADSLFQAIGVAPSLTPQAPPDEVLILPAARWHEIFDPQAAARPDTVRTQLHVRIAHDLPPSPDEAFVTVQQRAHHLEASLAGGGAVGDNLAATLDRVRADALYARVLLLFLGLPGAILALLLTLAVAASGGDRRRQEVALLRARGATPAVILRLEAQEALIAGCVGVAIGLVLAVGAAATFAALDALAAPVALVWVGVAVALGPLLAVVAVLAPAWLLTRRATVASARLAVGPPRAPLWQRLGLDVILLFASALVFWQSASSGYQIVLAPEGVPQVSVSYQAFIAPVCLWIGLVLLAARILGYGLGRRSRLLPGLLRPLAGDLRGVVAASLGRQRSLLVRGMVLVALGCSFGTSTAIFNTTYDAQARVDAQLTNGADVTVTGTAAAPPNTKLAALAALPEAAAAQPMQHRYAYVGRDLQDLYGIDPAHIGEATAISDAYFAGGNAQATLATLAAQPDSVLVSEETVTDYQLQPGDLINLRLQDARDHQYHVVPFHFVGVVREFPTAPRDSFLVANATYVTQATHSDAAEIVLLRARNDPAALAQQASAVVRDLSGAKVTDINTAQRTVTSSLTSIDLHGLTRLELGYALLLVLAATGLVLALGLVERRRTFTILALLGASPRQLSGFLWSEGLIVLGVGALAGVFTGFGVAQMLVTLLAGVFDPPPESLSVPWAYLIALLAAAGGSAALAILGFQRASRRPDPGVLRGL